MTYYGPMQAPMEFTKLSLGPVRTHYIIVYSDNLCISPKIKHNKPLEVQSDELFTC